MRSPPLLVAISLMAASLLASSFTTDAGTRTIDPDDDPAMHPIGFLRGVLPNPSTGEDLDVLYGDASSYTQFVPVRGEPTSFWELAEYLAGASGSENLTTLIRGNGMFPVVEMSFFESDLSLSAPPTIIGATLSDPEWRDAFRKAALDVVNASRPAYLSLGEEVNLWYEEHGSISGDPDGFQNWVSLYESVYSDVKALSPETIVFCSFAREVVAESREADMSVISSFDPSTLDLLVLTSHPFSVEGINAVEDIPDMYFMEACDLMAGKELGFSSVDWPSFSAFGGEQGQAAFIGDVFGRLTGDQGLDLNMVCWSHLTDTSDTDSQGLRYENGTPKSSLIAWINDQAPYYIKEKRTIELYEDFGSAEYNLTETFKDPDPWDILTFKVRNESGGYGLVRNFSLVDILITGSVMHLSSHPDQVGRVQVVVLANDYDGLWSWAMLQINVTGVNDPPRIAFPFGEFEFLEDHSLYVDVSYHVHDPDDDFELLTLEVMASPDLVGEVSGAFVRVFTRMADWFGETYMVLKVTDPSGGGIVSNISFNVVPVNDPPVIDLPYTVQVLEDGTAEFDLDERSSDVEGDVIAWDLAVIEGSVQPVLEEGNLTLVPPPDWFGFGSIKVTADDGTDAVTRFLNVSVLEVNDPPRIGNVTTIEMTEDETIYYPLSEIDPVDIEGTVMSWQVRDYSPIFRSVSIMDNWTMRIDPGTDDFGLGEVNVTLRDSSGGSTDILFPVHVAGVNDAPVLFSRSNATYRVVEGSFTLVDLEDSPFILYDVETNNDLLTVEADSALCTIDGLVINVSIPVGHPPTPIGIGIRVHDPDGASSNTTTIWIDVREAPGRTYRLAIYGPPEVEMVDGLMTIRANGDPYQVVWVVFQDGTSMRMSERPPGNGKYVLAVEDGPWEDGALLSFHLSAEEDGPNDTPFAPYEFEYDDGPQDAGDDPIWSYVMASFLLVALLVALVLLFAIRKRDRSEPQSFPEE